MRKQKTGWCHSPLAVGCSNLDDSIWPWSLGGSNNQIEGALAPWETAMLTTLMLLALAGAAGPSTPTWPAWGGPSGNFSVDGNGLPATFAAGAPKRLWQRNLGEGYSSIVTDGALLYTMYRRGTEG